MLDMLPLHDGDCKIIRTPLTIVFQLHSLRDIQLFGQL